MPKIKTRKKVKKRKCVICGASLSVYNKKNRCFHHKRTDGQKLLAELDEDVRQTFTTHVQAEKGSVDYD